MERESLFGKIGEQLRMCPATKQVTLRKNAVVDHWSNSFV